MKTQNLDIPIGDKQCDSFVAFPDDAGTFPAVILFMDAFGPRPYLKEMATKMAEQGLYVLVPNMFFRTKRAPIVELPFPLKMEDMPEARKQMMSIYGTFSPAAAMADVAAMLEFLAKQKQVRPGKIGVTGYCMGGGLALRTAAKFPNKVAAAASFHGGNLAPDVADSPHHLLNQIKAEIYIAHADKDGSMPPDQIERLRTALEQSHVRYEAELYEGAVHGFTMADLPAYNEAALERHWKKLTSLFQRNLLS